jgi:hypothetical protein
MEKSSTESPAEERPEEPEGIEGTTEDQEEPLDQDEADDDNELSDINDDDEALLVEMGLGHLIESSTEAPKTALPDLDDILEEQDESSSSGPKKDEKGLSLGSSGDEGIDSITDPEQDKKSVLQGTADAGDNAGEHKKNTTKGTYPHYKVELPAVSFSWTHFEKVINCAIQG